MFKKMILPLFCISVLFLFCSCSTMPVSSAHLELEQDGTRVTVRSRRLEVVIKDACFISCTDLVSGRQFAFLGNDAGSFPRGLGCINDDLAELRRSHVPWGSLALGQYVGNVKNTFLYPDQKSDFTVEKSGDFWKLSWENLTDGTKRFPACSLSMLLGVDGNGALIWQSTGNAPQGGIFGIQTPLANISSEVKFVFPHFGGMEFKHNAGKDVLLPFGNPPFWEAPVMAIELKGKSLGIWFENKNFSPYYAYHKNGPNGSAFAFELNCLMPFEDKTIHQTEFQKMDVFQGDWKSAMTPYKNWYKTKFADEIAIRDSIDWANKIRLLIDTGNNYEKVAGTFPPETVMYHNWNGRAPAFDTELPDWTPRAG